MQIFKVHFPYIRFPIFRATLNSIFRNINHVWHADIIGVNSQTQYGIFKLYINWKLVAPNFFPDKNRIFEFRNSDLFSQKWSEIKPTHKKLVCRLLRVRKFLASFHFFGKRLRPAKSDKSTKNTVNKFDARNFWKIFVQGNNKSMCENFDGLTSKQIVLKFLQYN